MIPQPQAIIHKTIVTIHQSTVTVPQFEVMVQHQPQSKLWTPQTKNILTVPVQPYDGKIHQPLVDINSSPIGGKYILWSQAPITGG